MSVPLKVGRTAPMFVLSFFLHSILLAGSALDSFQCLRSLLIVSFHVLLRSSTSTLSNNFKFCDAVNTTIIPYNMPQTNVVDCILIKFVSLLIPSFLSRESELMWSFKRTLHVPPNHCSIITLQFKQVIDIGGPTLTGIQQDSADIHAVYLPTCDV